MKPTTLILCLLLISSCYTKKKAIEKFCTQSKVDTTIVIRDTVVLDSTRVDTVFSSRIDSIFIQQGKLSIKYIKVRDSVYLSGKYDADTIVRVDTIRVSMPVTIPNCELTKWEWIRANWMRLLLVFVVGFIIGALWGRR